MEINQTLEEEVRQLEGYLDLYIQTYKFDENDNYKRGARKAYSNLMLLDNGYLPQYVSMDKLIQYDFFVENILDEDFSDESKRRDMRNILEDKIYKHMLTYNKNKNKHDYKRIVDNDFSLYKLFSESDESKEFPLIREFNYKLNTNIYK